MNTSRARGSLAASAVAGVSACAFLVVGGCQQSSSDESTADTSAMPYQAPPSIQQVAASYDAVYASASASIVAEVQTMTSEQAQALAWQWVTDLPWSNDPVTAARGSWAGRYLDIQPPGARASTPTTQQCTTLADDMYPLTGSDPDAPIRRILVYNDCMAGRLP